MDSKVINIKDTDSINCSNCGKSLLMVYCRPLQDKDRDTLLKNNALLSKVQVSCPYCESKSFEYEIVGQFRYHPVDGIKINGFEEKDSKVYFKTSRS